MILKYIYNFATLISLYVTSDFIAEYFFYIFCFVDKIIWVVMKIRKFFKIFSHTSELLDDVYLKMKKIFFK